MLALWTAVARDAPVGRFGQTDFVAYLPRHAGGPAPHRRLGRSGSSTSESGRARSPSGCSARSTRSSPTPPRTSPRSRCGCCSPCPSRVGRAVRGGRRRASPAIRSCSRSCRSRSWAPGSSPSSPWPSSARSRSGWSQAGSLFEIWLGLFGVFSGYLVPLELFPGWVEAARARPALPLHARLPGRAGDRARRRGRARSRELARPVGLRRACSRSARRLAWRARPPPLRGLRRLADAPLPPPPRRAAPRLDGRSRMQYRVRVPGARARWRCSGRFWSLVPLLVVFGHRPSVAGWSFDEALVVMGWFTLMKGVLEGAVNPSPHQRRRAHPQGHARLRAAQAGRRPVPRLDREVRAVADRGRAGRRSPSSRSPSTGWAACPRRRRCSRRRWRSSPASAVILYSLWILVVSAAFFVVKVDNLSFLFTSIFDAARWPISVFRGRLARRLHLRRAARADDHLPGARRCSAGSHRSAPRPPPSWARPPSRAFARVVWLALDRATIPRRSSAARMLLRLTFLGTSAAQPTVRRNLTGARGAARRELFLVDCGEGTQRQLIQFGAGFDVAAIFFTHFHADHYLGAIGFLRTLSMQNRTEPLDLYGPRPARRVSRPCSSSARSGSPTTSGSTRSRPARRSGATGARCVPFPTEHRIPSLGCALREDARPGRFHPERAAAWASPRARSSARCSGGEAGARCRTAARSGRTRWWSRRGAGRDRGRDRRHPALRRHGGGRPRGRPAGPRLHLRRRRGGARRGDHALHRPRGRAGRARGRRWGGSC